ncbi:MAG TPA: flagellar motor switch phosphatase FliY [Lachnospiraceae bacterium]|jgi:flagellar motor switch protein FliN/FliY|nr:flagellar motor switch phosphatase FliY [Lachnospiraceae bacterium]HBY72408.1 flagellar motor switch phosphatase FliY [Lachnospiraceae bacterium]HCA69211.1 flagellar motor switch phosphatase FliY [Lachnospiraceae bacterium]HCM14213.1 flagellar motor switch phosphatase FliY [Lachnospiraceae bacterium]HCR39723.1 flagellar motor switch phosphatase FliY [Lachnospiraceae bacterium]
MDGMLSQEEINALLNGMTDDNSVDTETLTDEEKDAIGEISNISMGTAATTLSSLVNQKVVITTPVVEYATWKDITESYDRPCVFIQIYYEDGLDGNNILILKENDVKVITDLMMGGTGTFLEGDLSDMHLSAISEAMNQMMGSAATSISSMLDKRVNISPPASQIVDLDSNVKAENIAEFLKGSFVRVSFHMEIGDMVDSVLMQLYPFDFARKLYQQFMQTSSGAQSNSSNDSKEEVTPAKLNPDPGQNKMPQEQPPVQQPQGYNPSDGIKMQNQAGNPAGIPYMMPPIQDVNVAPVQFAPFTPTAVPVTAPENIDLLMDVPLEVTVELGRTSKSIKDILDFSPGTIIELNRLAGEPIDVLVNGKFVAKGEVVVMEEAFGIRITEITKQNKIY